MVYKVVYIEDQAADSVIHDLNQLGLDVEHCKPTSFSETTKKVDEMKPDLILMDYRLMAGGGEVDAPSIAQYYRSSFIDRPEQCTPIVLLSNDNKIHDYYRDFTSHDLFDFSISKENLSENKEKYSSLMKELINSYTEIAHLQDSNSSLVKLLSIPESIEDDIDPRIIETLERKKYKSSTYLTSSFILNNVVKPIGVLIGEDVLSARLGISTKSEDWHSLLDKLKNWQYTGLYSETYKRWWAAGVEEWWSNQVDSKSHLRRLNSQEKLTLLNAKFEEFDLKKIDGDPQSITNSFWTICQSSFVAVDPSEAFEIAIDLTQYPWIDSQFLSYESVRSSDLIEKLTDFERIRYKEQARSL